MTKVLFIKPWNFRDENKTKYNRYNEWRNGPYNLLLLATILRNNNHEVLISDLESTLVLNKGSLESVWRNLEKDIIDFKPDIIGLGFFSVHFTETKKIVNFIRKIVEKRKLKTLIVGGGIHCSVNPLETLNDIEFDCVFVGEADIGILELADGKSIKDIEGFVLPNDRKITYGRGIKVLDDLPFPDWSLCNYKFYSHPSYLRNGFVKSGSLDLLTGRGCVYQCGFCAYSVCKTVRFYSIDYIIEQIKYMKNFFKVREFYFLDSSIGNNRNHLLSLCERLISSGLSKQIYWFCNLRSNQIDEDLIQLLWKAGCRFVFYGFESGSQKILDAMNKKVKVESNYYAANLHNKYFFPYNASMIVGYLGETEEDIQLTIDFLKEVRPPKIGINCYVPLPGSKDYEHVLQMDNLQKYEDQENKWRLLGQTNSEINYTKIEDETFLKMVHDLRSLSNMVVFDNKNIWNQKVRKKYFHSYKDKFLISMR